MNRRTTMSFSNASSVQIVSALVRTARRKPVKPGERAGAAGRAGQSGGKGGIVMSPASDSGSYTLAHGRHRVAIFHVDDLGMCQGANAAFLELSERGAVSCGAVMVPCPWFEDLAEAALHQPDLDVGVHLTLTSEWTNYRWKPVSAAGRASGLVDADGYFWRDLDGLRRHLVPEAAEQELRAQIERALSRGVRLSHVDAHMAAAMLPELLDVHLRLAIEYGVVPVLPRGIRFAPDPPAYDAMVRRMAASGLPVPDHCRATLPVPGDTLPRAWRDMIQILPPGITHFALHCTVPGEIMVIAPGHADWRINEYALFRSHVVECWCEQESIAVRGYRDLQPEWQRRVRAMGGPVSPSGY
jgi:predicted glycoside hydrolase/deacetylase ChbG (UPF0249 family)